MQEQVPNQLPLSSTSPNNSDLVNTKTSGTTQNRNDDGNESSSENSDDEGIFHKFSAPNIFKKWRTNNRQVIPPVPSSPKSTFFPLYSKDSKEEKDNQKETKGMKEQSKDTGLSSPTSPKPLVKAFGKLKLNSKSVAANFKSYLSQRGDKVEGESSEGAGCAVNGPPSIVSASSPGPSTRGIQKSASSGSGINVFSQVVQDYSKFFISLIILL